MMTNNYIGHSVHMELSDRDRLELITVSTGKNKTARECAQEEGCDMFPL